MGFFKYQIDPYLARNAKLGTVKHAQEVLRYMKKVLKIKPTDVKEFLRHYERAEKGVNYIDEHKKHNKVINNIGDIFESQTTNEKKMKYIQERHEYVELIGKLDDPFEKQVDSIEAERRDVKYKYRQWSKLEIPTDAIIFNFTGAYPVSTGNVEVLTQMVRNFLRPILKGVDMRHHELLIKLNFEKGNNTFASKAIRITKQNKKTQNEQIADVLRFFARLNGHFVDGTGVYSILFIGMEINIVHLNNKQGGCSNDRKVFKKFDNKKGNGKLKNAAVSYSPKSKNNNCLFAVLNEGFEIKGNVLKADDVRKSLNIELGREIRNDEIDNVIKFYNKKFNKNYGYILYKHDGEIIQSMKSTEKLINIMVHDNHYHSLEITMYKQCKECGRELLEDNQAHRCNKKMMTYYQNKVCKNNFLSDCKNYKASPIVPENLVFFDIETFQGSNISHVPYCVAWKCGENYYCEYGLGCFNKFIEYCLTNKNKTYIAYNSCRFDNYFLMDYLINENVEIRNHLSNNNRLMKFEFGENNSVFDLCLFLDAPLKKACSDFNIENSKKDFDHNRIKNWDDVKSCRIEVEYYIKFDVLSLEELFFKFEKTIFDVCKFSILDFMTLSSLSYSYWVSSLDATHKIELLKDTEKYNFVKSAVYGARCYPLAREFKSKHYDDVVSGKMTFDELINTNDFLFPADASSLYPASMNGIKQTQEDDTFKILYESNYPNGKSRWSCDIEKDFKDGKYGFYDISFETNKKLRIPLLLKHCKDGSLSHDLIDGRGVYTHLDIQFAIKHGYKVLQFHKALVYDSCTNPFKIFVDKFYKLKNEAEKTKNKVLRNVAKLILNSLYGKMLQQPHNEHTEFIYNLDQYSKFVNNYKLVDYVRLDTCLILTGEAKEFEKTVSKPLQLGAYVLAHSRMIMSKYMEAITPDLTEAPFVYSDTDSMYMKGEYYHNLKAMDYIRDVKKVELGLLCSDVKDIGLVIKMRCYGPKLYMYEYIAMENGKVELHIGDSATLKAKGIPIYDPKFKGTEEKENHKLVKTEMYDNAVSVECEFNTLKKKHINLTKKDKENNISMFSIVDAKQKRTFLKTEWGKMIYKNGEYYPRGYAF
jgi:hypothetical protein